MIYMKKILVCLAFIFLSYKPLTTYFADKFSLSNIRSDLEYDPRWKLPPSTIQKKNEVKEILSQPFSYLGKGMQTFVFQSADEKYVLKLFRHHRYRPLPYKTRASNEKRAWKRQCFFESCMVMQRELAEQTGLIYLHLNKEPDLQKKVALKDKLHRTLILDIDQYAFVVQRKATPPLSYIENLMEKGECSKAQKALIDLLALLEYRYQKGIDDRDAVLHRNTGFIEDSPVFLDIGQFFYNEEAKNPLFYKSEMYRVTRELSYWLKERYPQLYISFEETLYTSRCRH